MNPTRRNRLQLALIAALFLLPFLVAAALRFGGWEPPRTRNHGELLDPPLSMHGATAERVDDGGPRVFENTEREWSLLLRRPARCDAACEARVAALPQVHEALGRHAPKLHLFVLDDAHASGSASTALPRLALAGALPAPLAAPPPDALPELFLIDPHGYLVMHYPPGFDAGGLRRDLARLVRR